MAYDDKELKIGGDIYRRHEGVLEVMLEEFFGRDWMSYSTARNLVEFLNRFGVVKK